MILAGISLIGILAFCAYWPSLHAPFVFDDQFAILENHSIEHMADLRLVLSPPAEAAGAAGRPLVNLTLAINYAIGHYNVFGYHLFNVCLHILTSVVLFLILLRALKLDSSYWFSLSVVSIWALHPLLTESVSCVIQRDEILGAFFILLTLYAFIKSIDSCSEQHAKLWKSVSLLACSVGIGAKETIICAPLIVFLYDSFYVTGSFLGSLKIRKGYYTVLCATWIPLFYLIFNSNKRGGTVGFGLGVSTWSYLLTQTKALCIYIKLVLWPRPLIIDYGTQLVRGINEIPLQAIFISGVLIVTLYGLIRKQSYAFLGAVFFILLAPSSSFVPLVSQPIAEHRMYLPSIVVLVSLSLIIVITLPSKFIPVLSSVLISILLILTYLRNNDYQNELNLINQCISYNPLNDRAYLNRGTLLSRDGKIDEAIQDYETALKLNTKSADTRLITLGLASDPGVLEINLYPCKTWSQYDIQLKQLYAAVETIGLSGRKLQFNGRVVGSGGGAHIVFGGPEGLLSPFFAFRSFLPSVIRYWQHHPALSYAFTGAYMGPSSQAPRIDESTYEALYELEIACNGCDHVVSAQNLGLYDLLFRDLLMDRSGNTHRAEISVDKLWNPWSPNGQLGLVEFRAFEMHPDYFVQSVTGLFVRTILARLVTYPFREPFIRFLGELHDRYFLPSFVWEDLNEICDDLRKHNLDFNPQWLKPHWNFRFFGNEFRLLSSRVRVLSRLESN